MSSIGERIKDVRKALDMTQEKFSKNLGIGQSTLAMMEVSKRDISDRHIKTISAICDVNENWIRDGKGSMFSNSLKNSNINKRIQIIRHKLELTQEEFGEKLGVRKTAISRMELGAYKITDTMFKLICSEYHVNSEWLRNGNGEMFTNAKSISLDAHAQACGLSNSDMEIIKNFITIYPRIKNILVETIKSEADYNVTT